MATNISAWDSHRWSNRLLELTPGVPLVQYFCHPCGRNFIDEDLTCKRYAVHAGMLHHERLSDETTARWLAAPCPGERVVGDDADLRTRFLPAGSLKPREVSEEKL
jgi:hypothetical protein